MRRAYIDFTEFNVEMGNLRKAVDRAVAQADNQYSPMVFFARPSHVSEVEGALVDRSDGTVVSVNGASEVLTQIQSARKKAEGTVPNGSTDFVFTFGTEVRKAVMAWKGQGWNVYARWLSDLTSFAASSAANADTEPPAVRSRHRKYEVAKRKAKNLRVYAEWRARKAIYDAIEANTSGNQEVTLSDLKRVVMRQARQSAKDAGFDLQPNHFFAANDSVFRVALTVGVFRTAGGRAIGEHDVAYVVRVTDVQADFRERCDMFILECIVNELGDVTEDQCLSLAHLMYGEGAGEESGGPTLDDLDERFGNLMKLFGDRLYRDQFGFLKIKSQDDGKVQPIAVNSR